MKTYNHNTESSELQARSAQLSQTAPTGPWRGVFFDGPQADHNQDGDEIPVWCVYVGDQEAEPIHRVYWLWSYTQALDLAQRMATDRRLELVNDATTA